MREEEGTEWCVETKSGGALMPGYHTLSEGSGATDSCCRVALTEKKVLHQYCSIDNSCFVHDSAVANARHVKSQTDSCSPSRNSTRPAFARHSPVHERGNGGNGSFSHANLAELTALDDPPC